MFTPYEICRPELCIYRKTCIRPQTSFVVMSHDEAPPGTFLSLCAYFTPYPIPYDDPDDPDTE